MDDVIEKWSKKIYELNKALQLYKDTKKAADELYSDLDTTLPKNFDKLYLEDLEELRASFIYFLQKIPKVLEELKNDFANNEKLFAYFFLLLESAVNNIKEELLKGKK